MGYRMAADIGGTFTDFVVFQEETGLLVSFKVPSTPHDPSEAVLSGVHQAMIEHQIPADQLEDFIHGNTIGLNAILQGKGAKVGLLTSEGFRDLLELGRLRLPDVITLYPRRPSPLIPRRFVREVAGQIRSDGSIVQGIEPTSLRQVLHQLKEAQVESWAVSLKNGYVNGELESQIKEAITSSTDAFYISVSSEIWPEVREYERTLITVLNAYIHPVVDRYLTLLEAKFKEWGLQSSLYLTKSNGGLITLQSARRRPVETLLSGPASGAVGAAFIAKLTEAPFCIGVDMGGTSTDVCLIQQGEVVYSTESKIGEYPMIMPSVDISSIGAGGSSIAWIDDFGILKVGPESMGSAPGPACYSRGGSNATITDAYLLTGFLGTEHFAGGQISLNPQLAEKALLPLAEQMGATVEETCWDILRVATANMATELQLLLAKRGLDRRDFAILAYGGAGPAQASLLAQEVGIDRVVIPPAPGTLCAMGALITDIRNDYIQAFFKDVKSMNVQDLRDRVDLLRQEAESWFQQEGIKGKYHCIVSFDMRYQGEPYDLEITLPDDLNWEHEEELRREISDIFHQMHRQVYNFSDENALILIQNVRVRAVRNRPKPALPVVPRAAAALPPGKGTRRVYMGEWVEAKLYLRSDLQAGHLLEGPCIVEQDDTTTVILPGFNAEVDAYGNLLLTTSHRMEWQKDRIEKEVTS